MLQASSSQMACPASPMEAGLLLWAEKQRERGKAESALFSAVGSQASLSTKLSCWILYELASNQHSESFYQLVRSVGCFLHSGSLTVPENMLLFVFLSTHGRNGSVGSEEFSCLVVYFICFLGLESCMPLLTVINWNQ